MKKTYIIDDGVLKFPIKGSGPFDVFASVCEFSGSTLEFDAECLPCGIVNFNMADRCYQVCEHNPTERKNNA